MVESDRTEANISFIEHIIHIANLVKACTDLIMQDSSDGYDYSQHLALLHRVVATREELLRWFHRWTENVLTQPTKDATRFVQTLGQGDMECLISYKCFMIIYNRIYTALDGDKAFAFEEESQTLASSLKDLPYLHQQRIAGSAGIMCVVVSSATLATAGEWEDFCVAAGGQWRRTLRRRLPPETFCRWIELCGIKVPEQYCSAVRGQ